MEEWKKARAMMKGAVTILKENYEQEFVVLDVVTGLNDLIEHLNNMED